MIDRIRSLLVRDDIVNSMRLSKHIWIGGAHQYVRSDCRAFFRFQLVVRRTLDTLEIGLRRQAFDVQFVGATMRADVFNNLNV